MKASRDCRELEKKSVGVGRKAGALGEMVSASHRLPPHPHHVPIHPDPLQGWPQSGLAGKSGHAVVLRGSSWSGMWDIGHLAGPAETSPVTQFLCSHVSHISATAACFGSMGSRQALARANCPPLP